MCCIIHGIFVLCVVCVLTTMGVNIDIGMHDNYQKFYVCYMFTSKIL